MQVPNAEPSNIAWYPSGFRKAQPTPIAKRRGSLAAQPPRTMSIDTRQIFRDNFELLESGIGIPSSTPLHELRRQAFERFNQLGVPTSRHEEWRFTPLSPLTSTTFTPVPGQSSTPASLPLRTLGFDDPEAHQLVFIDGIYAPSLSRFHPIVEGLVLSGLADALQSEEATVIIAHLERSASTERDAFLALNTAFVRDGAYVRIADGVNVERPIHLLFLSTSVDTAIASHPRTLIVAGTDASATIIEEYSGIEGGHYFTNPATDLVLGERARITHCKLQHESPKGVHIGAFNALQSSQSTLKSVTVTFGSALVRNNTGTILNGEGAHATLDGLYVVGRSQTVDNHTTIDHAVANCTSHELYKGILDGDGRGVFSGKIIVRQDAQKTDSKQSNSNLLLSNEAVIDTKPQLEIFADDVKCTHGATIGQLDEKQIFYLRSRGIDREEARGILTYAFASDIIDRVDDEAARVWLDGLLAQRLDRGKG